MYENIPLSQLETLHVNDEFIVSRGKPALEGPSILLVKTAARDPSASTRIQLKHAYSFRDQLESAWAARPLALMEEQDQSTLVLEDPGGTPLDRLLTHPLELRECLRVGIGLAAALKELHARGLIHKDIKPANVLALISSGQVWLTGFGFCSRVPRERQAAQPPEVIAGTLAYMAPEQTGRMNRSIDSRADLYSCGVTLYQMLTGRMPFSASDAMEWVHCHIARQPPPPSHWRQDIPPPLDAIVMKLLAKTAEQRYQTAAGLEADLRLCLAAWEASSPIAEPFVPGAHDTSDQLFIPEKLYGREAEVNVLMKRLRAGFD